MTFRNVVKELSGAEPQTTNNRMELTAAAAALESLKRPCHVVIHTDSQYLKNGITRWITGWVRKGWKGSVGDPVANVDLWKRILAAAEVHRVEWRWVRGHDGNDMNERADRLATEARRAAFGGDGRP
jgi:ribonuclease HI